METKLGSSKHCKNLWHAFFWLLPFPFPLSAPLPTPQCHCQGYFHISCRPPPAGKGRLPSPSAAGLALHLRNTNPRAFLSLTWELLGLEPHPSSALGLHGVRGRISHSVSHRVWMWKRGTHVVKAAAGLYKRSRKKGCEFEQPTFVWQWFPLMCTEVRPVEINISIHLLWLDFRSGLWAWGVRKGGVQREGVEGRNMKREKDYFYFNYLVELKISPTTSKWWVDISRLGPRSYFESLSSCETLSKEPMPPWAFETASAQS